MPWPWASPSRSCSISPLIVWTVLDIAVGRLAWAFRSWTEVDLVTVWILAATALIYDRGLLFDAHALPESCQLVGILRAWYQCLPPMWFEFAEGCASSLTTETTEDVC